MAFSNELGFVIRARGGVDDGDGHAIGVDVGGEASGRHDARDVLREGFGGDGDDEAGLAGALVTNDDNPDVAPANGGGGVARGSHESKDETLDP